MGNLQSDANGTFTPADASEHNLFSDVANNLKYYMFKLNTTNMVSGDKIEIRIYDWDIVGVAYILGDLITLQGAQSIGVRYYCPPLPQYRFQVSYKEITNSGTHKAFNWERLSN